MSFSIGNVSRVFNCPTNFYKVAPLHTVSFWETYSFQSYKNDEQTYSFQTYSDHIIFGAKMYVVELIFRSYFQFRSMIYKYISIGFIDDTFSFIIFHSKNKWWWKEGHTWYVLISFFIQICNVRRLKCNMPT